MIFIDELDYLRLFYTNNQIEKMYQDAFPKIENCQNFTVILIKEQNL